MSWRDQALSIGMYLLIAHQLVLILSVLLSLTVPLNLTFLMSLVNIIISASLWLDLFGFLLVGIGFHAMGRFLSDDEDLKTQARTIGILLAFWSVPMFMFRASLQVLTTQKDFWTIISLSLGTWNFNALEIPTTAIKNLIYMLWVFSAWWPVLLIVHGITGFGLVAIPFFLESAERKLQLPLPTERFELKHIKAFFISTAALDIILFVITIIVFQPLIPVVTDLAARINSTINDTNLKQSFISLQGLDLFLFITITGIKQLLTAILAFLSWNYGLKIITSVQRQVRDRYIKMREKEKENQDETLETEAIPAQDSGKES